MKLFKAILVWLSISLISELSSQRQFAYGHGGEDHSRDDAQAEAARKAQEEAARKAQEEAARKAQAEAARKAQAEASRKAQKEAERRAAEQKAEQDKNQNTAPPVTAGSGNSGTCPQDQLRKTKVHPDRGSEVYLFASERDCLTAIGSIQGSSETIGAGQSVCVDRAHIDEKNAKDPIVKCKAVKTASRGGFMFFFNLKFP